eukprot:jgi/Chrzof1/14829/Cz09g17250.t1
MRTFALSFAVLILVAACCAKQGVSAAAAEPVDMTASPAVDADLSTGGRGTDTNTAAREAESMSSPTFQKKIRDNAQKFEFQAEVNRLMDILIHSLYSNKDIFLRELISNASDALDKIRFLSLTDKSVLGEGDAANLEIKIWLDKENKVLYLRDLGIGMTKDDLVKNLGTIAKSGTSAFLESMQKGGDVNLIGQFGVGFYSVYLVADWVEVVSKHNDDQQWIWASGADGSFSIAEDKGENEPLERGTLIKIHLKDEAQEYADETKLKSLVEKYSEFINFPIYLLTDKEVEVPVEEEEADAKEDEDKAAEGDVEDEEEGDDVEDDDDDAAADEADKTPKKTRKEKRREWELLNDVKAIWLRKAGDVSDEEYQKFYKAISKDYSDALGWVHFKAEGDVEFRSIIFVPKVAPFDFYDKYYDKQTNGLKLYVRRVFISDDVTELLPKYLSFLRGLVDSDTLPLNVSREMLQAHSSLKTIRKKLVRKALDFIKKLADDERKCNETPEGDDDRPAKEDCGKFGEFWSQFGRAMKLGIIEDSNNRSRLAKLLRFHTSKSPEKLTSLDEYISRMKEDQKQIYFIAGSSKEEVAKSPFLEKLVKKGYEVIYFTDVLDEYLMGHLTEYDDKKFANISKEDLEVGDEKADDFKDLKNQFKALTKWWKSQLGDKVTAVKVSNRLSTTPCVVVTSKFGQSANMERIMRAQAFSDPARQAYMRGQRSLEINPHHPIIKALQQLVQKSEDDAGAKHSAALLYETALLESGFTPDNVKDFSKRMYELMGGRLGVPESELHLPEDDVAASSSSSSSHSSSTATFGPGSDDNGDDEEDVGGKEEL